MLLFDVGEEGWVGEVPLSAGTAELAFCFFFGLDGWFEVGLTFLLTHNINAELNSNIIEVL